MPVKKKKAPATKQSTKKKTGKKKVAASKKKRVAKKAVKKVAKKSAKKSAKKKTMSKNACPCIECCDHTEAFWVHNGPIVRSITELLAALQEMSDEQYTHHTARDGNDFANWISDCHNNDTCAAQLRKARTRVGAVRILTKTCVCK